MEGNTWHDDNQEQEQKKRGDARGEGEQCWRFGGIVHGKGMVWATNAINSGAGASVARS